MRGVLPNLLKLPGYGPAAKMHTIFGTYHMQMDFFWKASSRDTIAWIQYCVNGCKNVYTRIREHSN